MDGSVGAPQGESVEGPDLHTREGLEAAFPWLVSWRNEEPTLSEKAFYRIEDARAYSECGQQTAHYSALFDVLLEMKEAAGATPLVVVLIPDEFQVEDDLWSKVTDHLEGFQLDRFQPQRLIGTWLEEQGMPFLDLLPILRAVPPEDDGDRHCYHQRNTHFNTKGNRIVGRAMAEFLAPFLP